MVIASTGQISFADIQNEFGGENPIGINEYYQDASNGLTAGMSGIPNIGLPISLSDFRGKSKLLRVILEDSTINSIPDTDFSYAVFTNTSAETNKISFNMDIECDVLIIGGGGGGGGSWKGASGWSPFYPGTGGDGGEFKETKIQFLANETYDIIIGKGGEPNKIGAVNTENASKSGSPSIIKLNDQDVIVANGGSPGNASWGHQAGTSIGASGDSINGKSSSITGVSKFYAAGGGTGGSPAPYSTWPMWRQIAWTEGGNDIGGDGGKQKTTPLTGMILGIDSLNDLYGKDAVQNTGSGGGGAGLSHTIGAANTFNYISGEGADGIVIIRWESVA